MAHRTFKSTAPAEAVEPTTFSLGGTWRKGAKAPDGTDRTGEWEEGPFTCLPVAPAGVLDDFVAVAGTDAQGNRVYDAPSVLRFLTGVLVPEDVPRLLGLVHDKDRLVQLADLGELVIWLAEVLTGRPTTPLSS